MAMLAFFVFVSRYYVTCRNRQFEQSRWMIVVALLLFVVHYMCQMRLGWRQQGNDVGVLFNLLFYSPSAILLSWSQLNILRAGHRRWSFMRYGVVGYALMVLCIVAGVIQMAVCILVLCYMLLMLFISLLYCIIHGHRWGNLVMFNVGSTVNMVILQMPTCALCALVFCGVCFCCNFASLYIVAAAALCLWTFGIDFAFAVYC